jgi:hypothetical protein
MGRVGQLSPRLGYYIVSFGTVLEFLGLVGDSWSGGDSSPASRGVLTFSQPGDVLLVLGLAITVLGTILGLLSLAHTLSEDVARPPRLLPALPLVLLVGISVGSVAFAYQTSGQSTATTASVSSQPSALVAATATPVCPPGTFWHDPTQRCLSLTVGSNGSPAVATPVPAGATPVCPAGTIWHPAGNHCLPTTCPAGSFFNAALFVCVGVAPATPGLSTGPSPTPVCPDGTFWHPVMNHCMPTLSVVCPIGYEWNTAALTCLQVAAPPTVVPTSTPTLEPGATPSPTAKVTPTPTPTPTSDVPSCPDGYFWHPAMGHCMSNTCPPGLVWDQGHLYCVLPTTVEATVTPATTPGAATATPIPVSTPACPDGYFWHPAMGHCMSNTCPPGLVWDADHLYCVLPSPPPG